MVVGDLICLSQTGPVRAIYLGRKRKRFLVLCCSSTGVWKTRWSWLEWRKLIGE